MRELIVETKDFDSIIIDNIYYPSVIFKYFAIDAQEGTLFRLIKRDDHDPNRIVITLKKENEVIHD